MTAEPTTSWVIRYDLRAPSWGPPVTDLYAAALEQCAWADGLGADQVILSEHHGCDDGYLPSPMVFAAAIAARTERIRIRISAIVLTLRDPVQTAEDVIVVDHLSRGRIEVICVAGYVPSEFAMFGIPFDGRWRVYEEKVAVFTQALTGEPFEYRGTTVQVTPRPLTQPHPTLMLGGSSKVAVRRAARFGLPYLPPANLPELEAYYYEQCAVHGTQGFCAMPPEHTAMTFVAEDPERVWRDLGHHFFEESSTYAAWQPPGQTSSVHSHATSVDELRAEGIYEVVTPAELVDRLKDGGPAATCALHPLVGGMPIDEGWSSLRLYVEEVLPALG
jgi:alkanesulfonate monooxygenase SsuD/methylene tetrahydromethanopterin reductase-like flavin-dependent oxidoreductase (luciferase family)